MSLLSTTLRVNALFSLITGLLAVIFADAISSEMSINPLILYLVGGGTALFGLAIFWSTRQPQADLRFGVFVVVADFLWVVGAIVVLALGLVDAGWILAVVSLPVLGFATLQTFGVIKATREEPEVISTMVDIDATPEAVWGGLVDFDGYDSWNPFIREGSGSADEGARLRLRMTQASGRSTAFSPVLTRVTEARHLEWLGSLGVPGVLDGRHQFDLRPTASGTRLIHREEFSGLLVPLMGSWLERETAPQFEAMNQALKFRVEESVRNSA